MSTNIFWQNLIFFWMKYQTFWWFSQFFDTISCSKTTRSSFAGGAEVDVMQPFPVCFGPENNFGPHQRKETRPKNPNFRRVPVPRYPWSRGMTRHMRPVLDSPRGGINALKFSGRSEKNVFRNLLPNTLGRVYADTSWAYSGMGAGLSKSAFGAMIQTKFQHSGVLSAATFTPEQVQSYWLWSWKRVFNIFRWSISEKCKM